MTTVVEPNVRVAVSDWLDCAAGTGDVYKVSVSKQNQDKVTLLLKEGPEAWLIQRPGALHDFAVEFKRLDDARDNRLRAPDNAKGHVIWSCKQAGATDVFGDINPRGSNSTTTPKRAPAPAAPVMTKAQELKIAWDRLEHDLTGMRTLVEQAKQVEARIPECAVQVQKAKAAYEIEVAEENKRQRAARLAQLDADKKAAQDLLARIAALEAELTPAPAPDTQPDAQPDAQPEPVA